MPTLEHATLHLQARIGQALSIELESMPGAGMVWRAPAAPAGCTLRAAACQAVQAGVGGPVLQQFVLSCDHAAEHSLRFELKRAWERELQAVQPVRLTVR